MVSAETPSENMRALYPINEWTGGRYFLCNGVSTDKPIFKLRKATKVTSKLLRPFFLVSTLKRANVFIN